MIFALIAFFLLLIFLIDLYFIFYTWQARIKIGKIKEDITYNDLIFKCGKRWLRKTPSVKLTDNDRLILIDILKGNYKRATIQHWQKAGLILGLQEYDRNSVPIGVLLEQTHPNQIPKESDYVIYAYALLKGSSEKEQQRFKPYFDAVYQMILELKNAYQVVPYKSFTGAQMYVDTIGFIAPFLALYGKIYGNSSAVDLAINQIEQFNQYGMLSIENSLPAHTYNDQTKMHAGLYGWGRGMGWYAIGLIDVWKELKGTVYESEALKQWVINFSKTIIKFQRTDGSYGWHVLDNSSRPDSSTVVMLAYFMKGAIIIPEIEMMTKQSLHKSIEYLKSVTRRNGALDFCQGDTKSIGVYSQTFDILPFAQGYLLSVLST